MSRETKSIIITEEQVDTFTDLGYKVDVVYVAYLPPAPGEAEPDEKTGAKLPASRKTKYTRMGKHAVLRFRAIPESSVPGGVGKQFYDAMKDEFKKVDMTDMQRSCLSELMRKRFPLLGDKRVSGYISIMTTAGALQLVSATEGRDNE